MSENSIIIIGASSEIAKAFYSLQRRAFPSHRIITISGHDIDLRDELHIHKVTDYSDLDLGQVFSSIKSNLVGLQSVTIFNGQLHNDSHGPEKRLEELNEEYFQWIFKANTLTPMLCLKHLSKYLTHSHQCVISALSARVASINENELGGWYSYRASKAALNMGFKSAAIELKRRAKNTKLVLFHPGTADTPLSKPFQNNVPKGKLFTAEFSAQCLSKLIADRPFNGEVDYIDWQGKIITW